MKVMIKFIFTLFLALYIPQVSAKVLATVGQQTISSDDVKRTIALMEEGNPNSAGLINKDDALEQLINLKLALIDAKAKGVDKTEQAKEVMEAALVNYYVYSNVDAKYRNKQFSKKEINDYYKENPVIKFQRIAIKFNPSNKKSFELANSKLSALRGEILAKKISFEQAIKSLGQDAFIEISGTFDRAPLSSLPEHEISDVSGLPTGSLSSIIIGDNTLSLIKMIRIYPMSSEYSKTINEILKRKQIIESRKAFFSTLRKKYSASINVKN
jgi:hypothetical protein